MQNSGPKDLFPTSSSDTGKLSLSIAMQKCLESLQGGVISTTKELCQKCGKEPKETEDMGGGSTEQRDHLLSPYEPSLGNALLCPQEDRKSSESRAEISLG